MVRLIAGDNSFEVERTLNAIIGEFSGVAEIVDGTDLDISRLPDLLMGGSLFADSRLVIIKNLSENKLLWPELGTWLGRISDDIDLVLVESKPDKRTTTFKTLKSLAQLIELPAWTEHDIAKAEVWLANEAKITGVELNKKSVQLLINRVGVNQWNLSHALEKLALTDDVTPEVISEIIDINPSENVFNLFDTAIQGDKQKVASLLLGLEKTEDPFRLFALLTNQAFQLSVVSSAEPTDEPAKDFGIHPYVLSKLRSSARKINKNSINKIINIFAEADDDMKTSKAEPWLLIERALIKVASI